MNPRGSESRRSNRIGLSRGVCPAMRGKVLWVFPASIVGPWEGVEGRGQQLSAAKKCVKISNSMSCSRVETTRALQRRARSYGASRQCYGARFAAGRVQSDRLGGNEEKS